MKQTLTISALVVFGLCLVFKLLSMRNKNKLCDTCCSALFWLGAVLLASANLVAENYKYPGWAMGVGVGNKWHRDGQTKLQMTQHKHHHAHQAQLARMAQASTPCVNAPRMTGVSRC